MRRRLTTSTLLLVAAGFLFVQLAWILTMPPATGIDEFDHVHRAASVASGHWGYSHDQVAESEGRGDLIPVPRDIVAATEPACANLTYTGPANCAAKAESHGNLVKVACAAARYNPTFYVLVGYPASLFSGSSALLAMRVVAALLCTGMFVLAALAIRSWARTGWPLLALFLAATPTIMYSSSIAAPNGLNVASGLALWAALLGLVHADGGTKTRRQLLTIAAVAVATLVNTHTLGAVWLVLIVIAVAIQRGSWRLPRIAVEARRQVAVTSVVCLAGLAFAVGWVLAARTNNPSAEHGAFTQSWFHEAVTVGVPLWPLQAIAAFPMRDDPAPLLVYAIGLSLICALAALAVVGLVRRREVSSLLAIAFVAVVSLLVPLALTAVSFKDIGLAWQGRYEMPFTGGLLLLYGLALDRGTARLTNPVAAGVMALVATMNLVGQLHVVAQYDGSPVALATGWHAPSMLVLALLAVGYAACGALALRRTSTTTSTTPAATPVPTPATAGLRA